MKMYDQNGQEVKGLHVVEIQQRTGGGGIARKPVTYATAYDIQDETGASFVGRPAFETRELAESAMARMIVEHEHEFAPGQDE